MPARTVGSRPAAPRGVPGSERRGGEGARDRAQDRHVRLCKESQLSYHHCGHLLASAY